MYSSRGLVDGIGRALAPGLGQLSPALPGGSGNSSPETDGRPRCLGPGASEALSWAGRGTSCAWAFDESRPVRRVAPSQSVEARSGGLPTRKGSHPREGEGRPRLPDRWCHLLAVCRSLEQSDESDREQGQAFRRPLMARRRWRSSPAQGRWMSFSAPDVFGYIGPSPSRLPSATRKPILWRSRRAPPR